MKKRGPSPERPASRQPVSLDFLPAAAITMNSLREPDKISVSRALKRLESDKDLPTSVRKLPTMPGHFVLRASPAWRIFFRFLSPTQVLVEDIMHQRQIDQLAVR